MTQNTDSDQALGELVYALAAFLRSAVPNQVGVTTVQLIAGATEWENLLAAGAKVADQ